MDSNQPNPEEDNQPLVKKWLSSVVEVYRNLRNKLLRYFVPNEEDDDSAHVTTSNLEHHRKQILEQARRHVKPQMTTHSHVVRNSIIVGAVSLVVIIVGLYISVFRLQPTNNFYYQISQFLPIPVGEITGENINYDRVLFYFRAESRADNFETTNESDQSAEADISDLEHLKQSFIQARQAVYIESLAETQGVSVSDEEVEAIVSSLPLLEAGSADLDVVLKEFRGWTRDDLFRETRLEALKSTKLIPAVVNELAQTTSLDEYSSVSNSLKSQGAQVGALADIDDAPDQLSQAASDLNINTASDVIDVDGGLYVLFNNEDSVQYVLINSDLRKALLEEQATNAESISCFSDVNFDESTASIRSEARYSACLF